MIFSKGKPRALKPDKQRGLDNDGNPTCFMSGTAGMLPTCFDVQPVTKKKQIAQSEKPSLLFEQLLKYVTLPEELVLDQNAGSGSVGEACLRQDKKSILIEKSAELVKKIAQRLDCISLVERELVTC